MNQTAKHNTSKVCLIQVRKDESAVIQINDCVEDIANFLFLYYISVCFISIISCKADAFVTSLQNILDNSGYLNGRSTFFNLIKCP